MISTLKADHSMEITRGLIIVDILIVAGAIGLAIFLFWSPRSSHPENDPAVNSPENVIIENPTQ